MAGSLRTNPLEALTRSPSPETLYYKYPCDLTESEDTYDIRIDIRCTSRPVEGFHRIGHHPYHKRIRGSLRVFTNNLVITNHLNNDYPIGTYYLNRISCICPSFLKKVQDRIQSLFGKKITQTDCRMHNKEFDVYLRSTHPLFKKK